MRRCSLLLLAVLTWIYGGCATPVPDPERRAADLILVDGVIWTGDADRPAATALAIRGERLAAVGSNREAMALAGDDTRVIDLGGRFVVPGFNDNHVHFAQAARFLEFNVMTAGSQEDFIAAVEEAVAELAPGEWILGGFWGAYDQWARGSAGGEAREPFTPDVSRVEELTRRHPMFLQKFDNSAFAANRAALAEVGIDPADPAAVPEGVHLERDAAGRATGILTGPGVLPLFEKVVPASFSRERRLSQTRRALAEVARRGVTSLSDMSDDEQLALYRRLRDAGELTVRVDFRYPLERWGELAEQGIRAGDPARSGDAWIRLGRLKGHVDGIMGASSARFFEPYDHDPGNRGRWRHLLVDDDGDYAPERFKELLAAADRAGLQLTVHAIGDEANHLLLDWLQELEAKNGRRDRRFRLVHAQVMAPGDFPRLGPLGVIAEVQPYHLADDMRWMEERIGRQRSRGAYAFRSLAEGGAVLSFGTDWPGTAASEYPIDPLPGIYAAVARQTLAGEPAGGWFPEERIGIEEALRAYTVNNAYATYEEADKGTLAPGKLADVTVLSKNLLAIPPEEILDTEVVMTVVGGRVVYEDLPPWEQAGSSARVTYD